MAIKPDVSATTTNMPQVGIFSRVIAAGLEPDRKDVPEDRRNRTLRLTLLLTPLPELDGVAPPDAFPLSSWTSAVKERLAAVVNPDAPANDETMWVKLLILDPPRDGKTHRVEDTKPTRPPVYARAKRFFWAYGDEKGADDLNKIEELWGLTFDCPTQQDLNAGWAALNQSLVKSFQATMLRSGAAFTSTADKPAADTTISAVRAVRQTELAMGLQFMRARETAATMAAALVDPSARQQLEGRLRNVAFEQRDTLAQKIQSLFAGRDVSEASPDPHAPGPAPEELLTDDERIEALQLADDIERKRLVARMESEGADKTKDYYARMAKSVAGGKACTIEPANVPLSGDAHAAAIVGEDADMLLRRLDGPQASHVHGTSFTSPPPAMGEAGELREQASRRFFALQSTPSLARLFGLAVDLTIDIGAFLGGVATQQADASFHFIATDFGMGSAGTSNAPHTWTLAKLHRDDATPHFWPATRTELDLADGCDTAEFYTQYNGVLVLGHKTEGAQRFEITSLDVRTATETQEQRDRERRQLPAGVAHDEEELLARPIERQTMRTAGLTLLDRGREASTAGKLAVREQQLAAKAGKIVLLDADELTVGYRPDIGMLTKDGYTWRGLMHREVMFGASGKHGERVIDLLDCLSGDIGTAERTMYDSALLSLPMRLLPVGGGDTETIVEEIVTTWDGGPMGADAAGPDTFKHTIDDLPVGRRISLPTGEDDPTLRPPHLRFGWGYRYGLRSVYMGGASPSVAEATETYTRLNGDLVFPPGLATVGKPRSQQRRFLRHERMDAPLLLLPGDIARNGLGQMGFERSPEAIVRSFQPAPERPVTPQQRKDESAADTEARGRATPQITRRIFVVPGVPQDFAALHGCFDDDDGKVPRQGLPGVRHDGTSGQQAEAGNQNFALGGGFPFAIPLERRGLDSILYMDRRDVGGHGDKQGDSVFETQRDWESRRIGRYYPDPAVRYFVLALRHAGTQDYLRGQPRVVSVYDNDAFDYPNARPLEVTIVANRAKRGSGEVLQQAVLSEAKPGKLDPINTGVKVAAQRVEIELYAGEDYELDVWCAANPATLAKLFALVEALGTIALRSAADGSIDEAALTGLLGTDKSLEAISPTMAAAVRQRLQAQSDEDTGFAGIGGLATPGVAGLLAIAELVHTAALHRPVDEIAARRTLRVTHAVNRPLLQPEWPTSGPWPIIGGTPEFHAVRVARPTTDKVEAFGKMPASDRYDAYFRRQLIDDGSNEFLLGGSILIDLDTSDGFEIEASTAFPRSPLMDDANRRRAHADRRNGLWPAQLDPTKGEPRLLSTLDIYGFHVDPDGRVELPRSSITLMRVDQLKSPRVVGHGRQAGELEIIELESFYGTETGQAGAYPEGAGTVPPEIHGSKLVLPHAFSDGKARRLTLTVAALSRFGHSWQTASRRQADRDGKTFFHQGEALPIAAEASRSTPVDIWLPATVRPAKPVTRSPLPCFIWDLPDGTETTTYRATRTALVRVPLRREWFSSGEGERLGVVVWPPKLPSHDALLERNLLKVPRYDDALSAGPTDTREMDLTFFADSDLGPGGAYVTRWGGDPIRNGPGQETVFMLSTDFCDLADTASGAQFVEAVEMPIGSTRTADTSAGEPQMDVASETLTVSLITYEPRFDVAREEWYVDINIQPGQATDPFVRLGLVRYQPNAPKHLQVSEPVVEWTQVLPQRTFEVTATDGATLQVDAKVWGLASTGVTTEPFVQSDIDASHDRPLVRMTLCFESKDAEGRLLQQTLQTCEVAPSKGDAAALEDEPRKPEGAGPVTRHGLSVWTHSFKPIDRREQIERGPGRYFVFASEIDSRRPATYPLEPLRLKRVGADTIVFDGDLFEESGPRFSGRIDIEVAAAALKEPA